LNGRIVSLGHAPPRNTFKNQIVEPTIGLEPMNLFLTKEVLYLLSYVGPIFLLLPRQAFIPKTWRLCRSRGKIINGGEGRIRTSEGVAGRFTVCSLWPLGNLTKFVSIKAARPLMHEPGRSASLRPCGPVQTNGAGDGTRTRNLLITNQLLCQLSYASRRSRVYLTTSTLASSKKLERTVEPVMNATLLILHNRMHSATRNYRSNLGLAALLRPVRGRLTYLEESPNKSKLFYALIT
jgi:hypothetical protein